MDQSASSNVVTLQIRQPRRPWATLDLNVRDDQIHWSKKRSDEAGEKAENFKFKIPDQTKDTIELLADLQQLLVDLRPEEKDQHTLVDGMLYRVAQMLGDNLYQVLFSNAELVEHFTAARKLVRDSTHSLRIELEFSGESAYMASWPWEYLRCPGKGGKPDSGEFLVLSTNLVLNRTLKDRFGEGFATRKPELLVVVSRPRDLGPVECREIVNKIRELAKADVITLHELIEPDSKELDPKRRPVATWKAFEHMVSKVNPHIIHFIGHGRLAYDSEKKQGIGQLAFVGEDFNKRWVGEEEFCRPLAYPKLRLVFLQACESAKADPRANASGVAMRLAVKQVPAVIAMQTKVENSVANEFACAFYDMLKAGLPIDWAVMEGRNKIAEIEGLSESQKLAFGVPVVYLSSDEGLFAKSPETDKQSGAGAPAKIAGISPADGTECPVCRRQLKRYGKYCTNPECGVQLLCVYCDARLDDPDVIKGTICGDCGESNPPRKRAATVDSPDVRTAETEKKSTAPKPLGVDPSRPPGT